MSDYSDSNEAAEEPLPDTWKRMPAPSPTFILGKDALVQRVRQFVIFQRGNDSAESFRYVFNHYAKNGAIDASGLADVLTEAYATAPGFAGGVSRTVKEVLAAMDKNQDGLLDWDEFSSGVQLPGT